MRGIVVGLACIGVVVAAYILVSSENPTEGSNCPPRFVAQLFSGNTAFVPLPPFDGDRHAGRRGELNWCGAQARSFAFAGDAVLVASFGMLAAVAWRERRRVRHECPVQ